MVALEPISKPRKIMIDLGCGSSIFPSTHEVIGLDIRKRQNHVVGSALCSPLRSEVADMVVSRQLLEHVDSQTFIRECWRILKPNGKLFLETPNVYDFFKVLRVLRRKELEVCSEHIQTCSSAELRNLLERNGFRCLGINYESIGAYHSLNTLKHILGKILDSIFPMMRQHLSVTAIKDGRKFIELREISKE